MIKQKALLLYIFFGFVLFSISIFEYDKEPHPAILDAHKLFKEYFDKLIASLPGCQVYF